MAEHSPQNGNSFDIRDLGEITDLRQFDVLQGRSLTAEQARKLASLQQDFIDDALFSGLHELEWVENGYLDHESSFSNTIDDIVCIFQAIHHNPNPQQLLQPCERLEHMFERIHADEAGFSDTQKLFLEFLIGLVYVEMNVIVHLEVAKKMTTVDGRDEYMSPEIKEKIHALQVEVTDGTKMLEQMRSTEQVAFELGNAFQQNFDKQVDEADNKKSPEGYWELTAQVMKDCPQLEAIARRILSMRYIPNNTRILGIAQALHWSGFGGNGNYTNFHDDLKPFSRHSIGFHPEIHDQVNFTERMGLFRAILNPLKEREGRTLAALATQQFPKQQELNVIDLGAGPFAKGLHLFARALHQIDPTKTIRVTAAEVDGSSLAKLAQLKGNSPDQNLPNVIIEDALRIDLSQDFSLQTDSMDIATTSLVIHQLMDSKLGTEISARVLRQMCQVVRPGGFISWADAGEHAWLQGGIIPFNGADREGCVPDDIYKRISFADVAVEAETKAGQKCYKIPYRLSEFRYATPEKVAAQHGSGIYEYNVFQVIEVSADVLKELDHNRGNPQACDAIIARDRSQDEQILAYRKDIREDLLSTLKK
jgi:SAM-dependent methyltransferase